MFRKGLFFLALYLGYPFLFGPLIGIHSRATPLGDIFYGLMLLPIMIALFTGKHHTLLWLVAGVGAVGYSYVFVNPTRVPVHPIDLEGVQHVAITGGSKGIGLALAKLIREKHPGIKITAVSRSAPPSSEFEWVKADLSTFAGADAAAEQLKSVDMIYLNAGIGGGASSVRQTEDGLPMLLALNHVAQARLLHRIDPPPKRAVFVTSEANRFGDIELLRLPFEEQECPHATTLFTMECYGRSKVAQIMYAKALSTMHAVSVHPGSIRSKFGESVWTGHSSSFESKQWYGHEFFAPLMPYVTPAIFAWMELFLEPESAGAERLYYAGFDCTIPSGSYVAHMGVLDQNMASFSELDIQNLARNTERHF